MNRGVVTDQDHLDALQPHLPIRLGPPPVVARGHTEDATERSPHRETFVALLEVPAFEMLKRTPWLVALVAGDVDLAESTDDRAVAFDQDGGVEPFSLGREFCVAKCETDTELLGLVEKRLCLGTRHGGLVVMVVTSDVFGEPTREEGGERKLGEHHQLGTCGCSVTKHGPQSLDNSGARFVLGDGAELGGGNRDRSWRLFRRHVRNVKHPDARHLRHGKEDRTCRRTRRQTFLGTRRTVTRWRRREIHDDGSSVPAHKRGLLCQHGAQHWRLDRETCCHHDRRDDRRRHGRTVRTSRTTIQGMGADHRPRRRPVGSLTARCARVRARKLTNHDDFVEKLCATDKAACSCGDRPKPSILFTRVYAPVSVNSL